MNTEFFIAKRLFFEKEQRKMLSGRIIRIALFGVALGIAVMIISVAVMTGFKSEIRNKVTGFGAHIQIVNYNARNSFEIPPVSASQPFLKQFSDISEIKSVNTFATKPGIIKTEETTQGIVFKGVDKKYDWTFFSKNLIDGSIPVLNDTARSNQFLISENLSKALKLKTGDLAVCYFINESESNPRMLQLKVSGIFRTSLEEFDNLFVMGDLKQVQRLNDWQPDQVGGFELVINDFHKIDRVEQQVRNLVVNYSENEQDILRTETITSKYRAIFDWLSVTDTNVWVILSLITIVAGFNMISALLVLMLERIEMIGVLKAMGSQGKSIRKIFLYLSVLITGKGMLWGNVVGITLILIQKYFQVLKLNPETYYVDVVPVNFSLTFFILLNIASITLTTLMLVIPSFFISKITPEKTIRFD